MAHFSLGKSTLATLTLLCSNTALSLALSLGQDVVVEALRAACSSDNLVHAMPFGIWDSSLWWVALRMVCCI